MSSAFMIGPVFIQMFSTSRGMLLAGKVRFAPPSCPSSVVERPS